MFETPVDSPRRTALLPRLLPKFRPALADSAERVPEWGPHARLPVYPAPLRRGRSVDLAEEQIMGGGVTKTVSATRHGGPERKAVRGEAEADEHRRPAILREARAQALAVWPSAIGLQQQRDSRCDRHPTVDCPSNLPGHEASRQHVDALEEPNRAQEHHLVGISPSDALNIALHVDV
jgi:hypothetical protein